MGQLLHGSARTTQAIRRAIQHSQESLQSLATRYSINSKTVAKWRKRSTVRDARMGSEPVSTVLTAEQEAIAVAFRQHTVLAKGHLPVRAASHDSASVALGAAPLFSASRYQPPAAERGRAAPPKKKLKDYPIGYLYVDSAEVRTEEGCQYLFVTIDRTSKVGFAELHPRATRVVAADCLRRVLEKLPYKAHTVLTDNGVQFTLQPH